MAIPPTDIQILFTNYDIITYFSHVIPLTDKDFNYVDCFIKSPTSAKSSEFAFNKKINFI